LGNCRFISRFSLSTALANNKLRVTFSSGATSATYDLTFDDGDYYWSFDDSVTAGGLDFAKQLDSKLEAASTAEGLNWSINMLGVTDTSTSGTGGALKINVTGGSGPTESFVLKFSDTSNTTIDPRIFGWDGTTTDRTSDSSGELVSDYACRYTWQPAQPVFDSAPQASTVIAAQSISTGGVSDVVYWATTSRARWEVQYINAALVSLQCATESARATAAGITAGDPNAPFEAFYVDCISSGLPLREYNEITSYTSSDFTGPYKIQIGQGLTHDSLGPAVRPLPGAADLYHVAFDVIEAV
tara:strand:+ start:347 stop:1246 length:900 start_codon:yes stop_codon:yes gene_type:complete